MSKAIDAIFSILRRQLTREFKGRPFKMVIDNKIVERRVARIIIRKGEERIVPEDGSYQEDQEGIPFNQVSGLSLHEPMLKVVRDAKESE